MNIYQLLPTISYGDAIGNYVIAIQRLLLSMGYQSVIYAENIDFRIKNDLVKKIDNLFVNTDDILIYHLSTASELNELIKKMRCRKIMIYHNITPAEYYIRYNIRFSRFVNDGLLQIINLNKEFDYCLAVSEFNKIDLINYGYKCDIDVVPIIIDFKNYKVKPSIKVLRKYSDEFVNLLFVGRIAPNKKHEDIIKAFYYYHNKYNRQSRLIIVGNWNGMEKYYRQLNEYVTHLCLDNVIFEGHVEFHELIAYYKIANVFLCMSEHEGFCVPLVEAMYFNIPIIAYMKTAIPFTLKGTGIQLEQKDPLLSAGIINELMTNQVLRNQIVKKQQLRLRELSYENVSSQFSSYLEKFIRRVE